MKEKSSLSDIINHRIQKLNQIKESKIESFGYSFKQNANIKDILLDQSGWLGKKVKICGRIIALRKMGKACFIHIQIDGDKIQLYVKTSNLEENVYDSIVRNLDIGDIVGVSGEVFLTKTSELSIRANSLVILSKNIRPLPNLKEKDGEAFFAFNDKELRYRNRHLDLITNPETRSVFIKRASIIKEIRDILDGKGFLEVETPCLQPLYGGASARPFTTHHNTLDKDLYLRIASELYLKRLIVGGFDRVYEIGKNFRNEGMDKNHNPEFTMLEFYCAYADVYDMLELTEKMIRKTFIYLKEIFTDYNVNIDFMKKFEVYSFFDKLKEEAGIDFKKIEKEKLYDLLVKNKVSVDKKMNYGKLLDKAFSFFVEPKLINPTFIVDYPLAISPLAKRKRNSKDNIVERFELFVSGMEIANSFSELNDPQDQAERMNEQNKLRELGDEEAQTIDYNFLNAMECGMPPCGGVGIGIDRLVMLLTSQVSIKDVILFPAMRNIKD